VKTIAQMLAEIDELSSLDLWANRRVSQQDTSQLPTVEPGFQGRRILGDRDLFGYINAAQQSRGATVTTGAEDTLSPFGAFKLERKFQ